MRTGKLTVALAFGMVLGPLPRIAGAEPLTIAPPAPLTVPTPDGPKLRLPEMAPPPPSVMLDQIRPLHVPERSAERPTLNRFPSAETNSSEDDSSSGGEEAPRIYLQHR